MQRPSFGSYSSESLNLGIVRNHTFLLAFNTAHTGYDTAVAFTKEDLDSFKDPVYYKQFRHDLEADLNVSPITVFSSLTPFFHVPMLTLLLIRSSLVIPLGGETRRHRKTRRYFSRR